MCPCEERKKKVEKIYIYARDASPIFIIQQRQASRRVRVSIGAVIQILHNNRSLRNRCVEFRFLPLPGTPRRRDRERGEIEMPLTMFRNKNNAGIGGDVSAKSI